MNLDNLISIPDLCSHYQIEIAFFTTLDEMGLVEIKTIETISYVETKAIFKIDKMIRIHKDLDVNIEGIDVVFNLLHKMETLQNQVLILNNRLRLYEG